MKLSDIRGSKSFMAVNPHLVGGLPAAQSKPNALQGLADSQPKCKESPVVGKHWLVVLVAHRKRPLDDDNLEGSCKPVRDQIADNLGVEDNDSRIKFEYHQIITKGEPGISVTIHEYEHLPKS